MGGGGDIPVLAVGDAVLTLRLVRRRADAASFCAHSNSQHAALAIEGVSDARTKERHLVQRARLLAVVAVLVVDVGLRAQTRLAAPLEGVPRRLLDGARAERPRVG